MEQVAGGGEASRKFATCKGGTSLTRLILLASFLSQNRIEQRQSICS